MPPHLIGLVVLVTCIVAYMWLLLRNVRSLVHFLNNFLLWSSLSSLNILCIIFIRGLFKLVVWFANICSQMNSLYFLLTISFVVNILLFCHNLFFVCDFWVKLKYQYVGQGDIYLLVFFFVIFFLIVCELGFTSL